MFNFEKLDVWQKAIAFADFIYSETRKFPNDERFGLTNQMRRAAVSISSNIAEGSSRHSKSDYARFVEIATGSVFEAVSQSFVAHRQQFLTTEDFAVIYAVAEEQGRMLEVFVVAFRFAVRVLKFLAEMSAARFLPLGSIEAEQLAEFEKVCDSSGFFQRHIERLASPGDVH